MALNADQIIAHIRERMQAAGSADAGLLAAVQAICVACGHPYGEVWTSYPERSVLYLKAAWYLPELDLAEFVAASRKFALAPGVGLPGRVWQSRQGEVVEDLRVTPEFSRQSIALAAGFRAAAGLPVICGDDLVAVLIFLTFGPKRHLSGLIERIAENVGTELSDHLPDDTSDGPGSPDRAASLAA